MKYKQSFHQSLRRPEELARSHSITKAYTTACSTTPTEIVVTLSDSASIKFGVTPTGGFAAGVWLGGAMMSSAYYDRRRKGVSAIYFGAR